MRGTSQHNKKKHLEEWSQSNEARSNFKGLDHERLYKVGGEGLRMLADDANILLWKDRLETED